MVWKNHDQKREGTGQGNALFWSNVEELIFFHRVAVRTWSWQFKPIKEDEKSQNG